ncbi:helix-turn-helix transcriptional regulator [Pengzhenrongella frigida]|uniref:helix-turn-helix transcriptional regulator n=1 Tax=Pengzhenrongella frigida TaxID=1259133 RepID=UPI0013ED84AD|nr:winged helix-turn-helix transcriptional regulator [Cellulomonas sp. HLT2-17]
MPSEPIDARTHRVLSGASRVAVLEVIRADGPLDIQAIATRVALHPNTVRSHLDRLIKAGLVESSVSARVTPGRPRLSFAAVAGTTSGPDDSYRMLAGVLAGAIGASASEPGAVATEMGRRWGRQATPLDEGVGPLDGAGVVDRIVTLLDDVGFAPTVRGSDQAVPIDAAGDPTVIELHRCPFVEVAREHRDVVCAVHLGLMQGALEQLDAPPTAVRLEPFVRPDLCLVHLAPGATGAHAEQ